MSAWLEVTFTTARKGRRDCNNELADRLVADVRDEAVGNKFSTIWMPSSRHRDPIGASREQVCNVWEPKIS